MAEAGVDGWVRRGGGLEAGGGIKKVGAGDGSKVDGWWWRGLMNPHSSQRGDEPTCIIAGGRASLTTATCCNTDWTACSEFIPSHTVMDHIATP